MEKLLNVMKMQADMGRRGSSLRIGLVSSYDPNNYSAKVLFQPEGIESGWLPISAEWIGNGWGLFMPPSISDMVLVEFLESDFEAGIITKRLYNDSDRPLAVNSGEMWAVHKSGSFIKMTNDGKATVQDKAGSSVVLNGDGTGQATFSGALTIKAAAIKLQNGGTALLNLLNSLFSTWALGHVHTVGGVTSSPPTVAPPSNTQTTIVQAE